MRCRLILAALLFGSLGCQPRATVAQVCGAQAPCPQGLSCVNGLCLLDDGGSGCSGDQDCVGIQVCGDAGLCVDPDQLQACLITTDCPDDQYCNPSLAGGTCLSLLDGACRMDSQCRVSMHCSASVGGVGRCVECLGHNECASGQCLPSGRCAPTSSDAGATGRDATLPRDSGTMGDDPSCGGRGQPCCQSSPLQSSPCDGAHVCLRDFPSAGDARCWSRCTSTVCTTLEGSSGSCHVSSIGTGSCQGAQAYICQSSSQCVNVYGTGECVYFDATLAYCFAMGCDYQADCGAGYYCSTYDGDLCLDVNLLGG